MRFPRAPESRLEEGSLAPVLDAVDVVGRVVSVKESHALQSEPSKARTHMVSVPPAWPPCSQVFVSSLAAIVIVCWAAGLGLLGVQKWPLVAAAPPSQNWYWVAGLP